jgi:hypothetical protein
MGMTSVFRSAIIGLATLAISSGAAVAASAPSSPANPDISGTDVALMHQYCAVCQYVPTGRKFCFNTVGITEIDARTLAAAQMHTDHCEPVLQEGSPRAAATPSAPAANRSRLARARE